jgi:hypothetical protein
MAKEPGSHPAHGEGPGPHHGREQHGWSPDVDQTHHEDNPSAHRSFHPDRYAPKADPGREPTEKDKESSLKDIPAKTGESVGKRGEQRAKSGEKGRHDQGTRGRSGRPSGSKDDSAYTGVDPQDPHPDKK